MTPHKRRNIFIKKDFQGKLILGYFLFVVGGCLFFFVLLGFFSADSLTISYQNHDLQFEQTPIMLFKKAISTYWLFIVVISVFLIAGTMFITHRIAGPIYRFEKTLDRMLKKDLNTTIKLRPKDEGKALAEKINQFNKELSQTLITLQRNTKALEELLSDTKKTSSSIAHENKEELLGLIRSMEEKNKQNISSCSSYILKDD